MNNDPKDDSKDSVEYSPPEIFELGDADVLTLGQSGPSVDVDAQHAPKGPNPAS